jgi:hypothetical protein
MRKSSAKASAIAEHKHSSAESCALPRVRREIACQLGVSSARVARRVPEFSVGYRFRTVFEQVNAYS